MAVGQHYIGQSTPHHLIMAGSKQSQTDNFKAGFLFDATGRYDTSFFMAGSFLIVAGLVPTFTSSLTLPENKLECLSLHFQRSV
jgi:hypothetical protein